MIVVFGSINIDLVVRVDTLPRPGETVLAPGYVAVPGGKGANQALAAARAGATTHMVGCVGRDGYAEAALATMRAAGVDLTGVTEVDEPTACAMIAVDTQGRNQIAVASGANRFAKAGQLDDALLGPGATLLLQLEVDDAETAAVAARARARRARVVLNAAQVDRGGYFREQLRSYYDYQEAAGLPGGDRPIVPTKRKPPVA